MTGAGSGLFWEFTYRACLSRQLELVEFQRRRVALAPHVRGRRASKDPRMINIMINDETVPSRSGAS